MLPKASTPKTATLTKMEYGEQNRIHVEYYSPEEWAVLEDNALVEEDHEIYQTAREIIQMIRRSGIDPSSYLEQGIEEKAFDSYEELMENLNEYVGEDGRFTPLVKAVTLYMNKEEFKNLSIVDTPGLNDAIVSRTMRTKEFMEVCDVVFFLSQSGSFLDKSDWTLLSSQLPQKGVKKLVLIASKCDSGVRDVLKQKEIDEFADDWTDDNTADTIPGAYGIVANKLMKRAKDKVTEYKKDLQRRRSSDQLIAVIEQCKDPVLVSCMCHNMSDKPPEQYNAEEQNVYRALKAFSSDISKDLRLLSNMDRIQAVFDSVVMEKDEILSQKARAFVPTAAEELKQLLEQCREKAEKKLALLSGSDREQLLEQKRMIENQLLSVRSDVITMFGEINAKLESEKAEAIRDLRQASKEYSQITERTGTEVKRGERTYSTSKWYNPFSWGSTETEYYTYDVSYSYLNVSDALENVHSFAQDACNGIEKVFTDTIHLKEIKRKLLHVVMTHFDMGSEKYDSALFRLLVEENLNVIEYPIFKLDITAATNQLASKFSGKIRSASEKLGLNQALMNAVAFLLETMSDQLASTVKSFKEEMNQIAEQIISRLLENVQSEFNELLTQYDDREQQIAQYRTYIYQLTHQLNRT